MKNIYSILLLLLLQCQLAGAQIISTFAGNHQIGNGGQATAANIVAPTGIAIDGSGNIYVNDWPNGGVHCRIRKISPAGIITNFAGDTTSGFSGDGGPAAAAQLSFNFTSLCTDPSGNVYIADNGNYRIRKISTTGIITTVAGNGTAGFSGDGGPATAATIGNYCYLAADGAGNLYIGDADYSRVRKVDPSGIITTCAGTGSPTFSGTGVPATLAGVSPYGLACDIAGNLYISDANSRIRKVNTAGIITTIAGTGTSGFSGDGGLATAANIANFQGGIFPDAAGNIYFSDCINNRIRKISTSGIITTVAGNGSAIFSGDGGPATAAGFSQCYDGAVDASGNIYFTDVAANRVRKVTTAGNISTIAGDGTGGFTGDGGPAKNARLFLCEKVTVDTATGNVYISDFGNNRVRKVNTTGTITTFAGNGNQGYTGDGGPATSATLGGAPEGLVAYGGSLYFCDAGNACIRKVAPSGIITTVAGNGTAGYTGDGGPATSAQIINPNSVVFDNSGNLYISDIAANVVRKVNPAGIISTFAGNGTTGYSGDGGPAVAAAFNGPAGMVFNASGELFVADQSNHVVRKINTSGIVTTVAGSGTPGYTGDGGPATSAQLNYPEALVFDKAGNLLIADDMNFTIRTVDPSGKIATWCGIGTGGYFGDGGPVNAAMLYFADGLAVDKKGRVYINDGWNSVIRVVGDPGEAPVFNAGPSAYVTICNYGAPLVLDTLLAITDIDTSQPLRWTMLAPPMHGSVILPAADTSAGTVILPHGSVYYPYAGFRGIDSFRVIISDGVLTDTITIYVNSKLLPVTVATNTSPVCYGDTIRFYATGTNPFVSYSWAGPAGFSSALRYPELLNAQPFMAGVYSVTASDSICTTIATTSVTVYPPVVLTGITADCSIAPGSTVQLDAAGAVMYLWSPHDGSLSNPNINNPVARPQQTTTYMVVGMNTLGCSDTAWVKVTVSGRDSFFIPDAFTPDGDGLNDVFHIRCADGYKLAEMAIYNRWGQLVYQGFGADCGWDGTWNNTAQDLGVYYFSATITTPSGNSRQPKGNITLIR